MSDKGTNVWSKVNSYYQDYGARAKELKKDGQRFMAYICSFVPLEIIHAAGFIPFRVRGDVHEPITKGDSQMETIACPFMRSCFDLSIKGKYSFCEGIVVPHACDSITRTYSVWKFSLGFPYSHFVNTPHKASDSGREFLKNELEVFRKSLGRFAGKEISNGAIVDAVRLYNENRTKAKALYEFRKQDPPLVSGAEINKLLAVAMSLPVNEANELFDEALADLRQRKTSPLKKAPRIMVAGACLDNVDLIQLIEDSGANMVVDSLCIGTRDYWPLTDETSDPLEALAQRYLEKINCPKTCQNSEGSTFDGDLEQRFGDVGALIKEFKVDGVILYVYKYCDPFGFEVPARKAHLDSLNIPVLCLEDEYSAGTIGRLRTRIQAFLEMRG
jgi:benzoyl-CoA reductase subunit C